MLQLLEIRFEVLRQVRLRAATDKEEHKNKIFAAMTL